MEALDRAPPGPDECGKQCRLRDEERRLGLGRRQGGELAPYELSHKGTVRFPLDRPVPAGLIGRIAKYRAGELAKAKAAKRKKAAKKPARVKAKP